jgi:hypothetical protein
MRKLPNFREFYQRALIPIGENDRLSALKGSLNLDSCSHWLLALEGNEVDQYTGVYHWKVVIYPAKTNGHCNYELPYFVSTLFNTFNTAIDSIRDLEKLARDDQLSKVFSLTN